MNRDREEDDQTAGRGERQVRSGETVSSIAEQTGHFWQTIWDHPDNEELKRARSHPNVLFEGDRLHVPPLRLKTAELATGRVHRFKKRGVPARLRVRFARGGKPRPGVAFHVVTESAEHHGKLDSDGLLDVPTSPLSRSATVTLEEDNELEVYEITLGGLDPEITLSGVRQRLINLGYPPDDESPEAFALAVAAFQRDHPSERVPVSGRVDDATRAALFEAHQRTAGRLPRGSA